MKASFGKENDHTDVFSMHYQVFFLQRMQSIPCSCPSTLTSTSLITVRRKACLSGSSPDFSRVFSRHLASRHLHLSRYSSHVACLKPGKIQAEPVQNLPPLCLRVARVGRVHENVVRVGLEL